MKECIAELLQSGKFCCVFTDDANGFNFGYLTDSDGEFLRMEQIDRYGEPDGTICQRIESITKIETDTKYAADIELLFRSKGYGKSPKRWRHGDVLETFLSECLRDKRICTVELFDSGCDDVVGFLTETDGEKLTFLMLDEHGEADGNAVFERGSISSIWSGSKDEEKIAALFRLKNAK